MVYVAPAVGRIITAKWGRGLDEYGIYSPLYTGETVQPQVGDDGSIKGIVHRNGRRITVWGVIDYRGDNIVLGGSSVRVSLPYQADLSVHQPGALATPGDNIGAYKTRSLGTGATQEAGAVLLYQLNDLSHLGKAVLFYRDDSLSSLNPTNRFGDGSNHQLIFKCQYTADGLDLP